MQGGSVRLEGQLRRLPTEGMEGESRLILLKKRGWDPEPKGKAILRAIGKGAAVVIFACGSRFSSCLHVHRIAPHV